MATTTHSACFLTIFLLFSASFTSAAITSTSKFITSTGTSIEETITSSSKSIESTSKSTTTTSSQTESNGENSSETEGSEENSGMALGMDTLGSLCLIFFLVWLINSQTPEIRQGTWKMMHGTVSIFFGVVFYSSLKEVYDAYKPEAEKEELGMIYDGAWVFFWYCVFALVLMIASGFCQGIGHRNEIVTRNHRLDATQRHVSGHENLFFEVFWTWILMGPVNKHGTVFNHRKHLMQSLLCFAHAMAFAGIDKWNLDQHNHHGTISEEFLSLSFFGWQVGVIEIFRMILSHVFFFLILPTVFWTAALKLVEDESMLEGYHRENDEGANDRRSMFSRLTGWCRHIIRVGWRCLRSTAAEPRSNFSAWYSLVYGSFCTNYEYDGLIKLFQHIRIEGENDYMALTLSNLVAQTIHVALTGNLPDHNEPNEPKHVFEYGLGRAVLMYAVSFLFLLLTLFLYPGTKSWKRELQKATPASLCGVTGPLVEGFLSLTFQILGRLPDVFVTTLMMSFAWCFRYGSAWLLAGSTWSLSDPDVLTILLALAMTLFFFFVAFVADWTLYYLDIHARYHASDTWVVSKYKKFTGNRKGFFNFAVTTVGILLGFTWEAQFDKAIEHVTEHVHVEDIRRKELYQAGIVMLLVIFALPVWTNRIIPMSDAGFKVGSDIQDLKSNLERMNRPSSSRGDSDKSFLEKHKDELEEIKRLLDSLLASGDGADAASDSS